MNNERMNEWLRPGIEFEGELVNVLRAYAKKNGTEKFFIKTAGTERDYFYGTDCIVDGIPVDLTCGFDRKGHIIELPDVVTTKTGEEIRFAIRTGNGHIEFKTPVIVIGINADPHFLSSWMEKIIGGISEKVNDIMDVVNERFYEYCDNNGIDPEEVMA